MRLGDDSNFLEVIPSPAAGFPGIFAVRARISDSLSEGSLHHQAVVFDSSETVRAALTQFAELKQPSFVLPVGQRGSITLTRDLRGAIAVSYRIPLWKDRGFFEGEVFVDGEYSIGLIKDFQGLLDGR